MFYRQNYFSQWIMQKFDSSLYFWKSLYLIFLNALLVINSASPLFLCQKNKWKKQQLSADFKFVYEQSLKQIFLKGAFLGTFENTIYKVITDHAQNQNLKKFRNHIFLPNATVASTNRFILAKTNISSHPNTQCTYTISYHPNILYTPYTLPKNI